MALRRIAFIAILILAAHMGRARADSSEGISYRTQILVPGDRQVRVVAAPTTLVETPAPVEEPVPTSIDRSIPLTRRQLEIRPDGASCAGLSASRA